MAIWDKVKSTVKDYRDKAPERLTARRKAEIEKLEHKQQKEVYTSEIAASRSKRQIQSIDIQSRRQKLSESRTRSMPPSLMSAMGGMGAGMPKPYSAPGQTAPKTRKKRVKKRKTKTKKKKSNRTPKYKLVY